MSAVVLASVSDVRRATAICVGDCFSDGAVTVDEIATLIAIATEQRPVADCSDPNADGTISVEEIVGAVRNLLTGCPRTGGSRLYPNPQFPSQVPVAADANQDGTIDLVLEGTVLLNGIAGTITGIDGDGEVSADFNGDGRPDMAAAGPTDRGDVSVFLEGRSCAPACSQFALGEPVGALAAGDFTGDGKMDLIASAGSADVLSRSNMLTIIEGRGDGTFVASSREHLDDSPWVFVVADFNRDHALDIVVATFERDGFTIFLRTSDGRFQAAGVLPFGFPAGDGRVRQFLQAGDLDGDGTADIVASNWQSGGVSPYWGNGDGTFKIGEAVSVGAESITVGDLNADGRDDVVVAKQGSNDLTVLYSTAQRTFEPVTVTLGSNSTRTVIADVDGDGRKDIIAEAGGQLIVLLRQGASFVPVSHLRVEAGAYLSLKAAQDLTSDGLADIVVQLSPSDFGVLLGNGDATFRSPRVYPALNFHAVFAIADANGDGHPDVFARDDISSIVLYLGDGRGAFVGPHRFSVGANVDGVAVADVSGDGIPDMLASSFTGGFAAIHGAGCEREPEYALGYVQNAGAIGLLPVAADVNRDGIVDFVSAGTGYSDFPAFVTLGRGGGTFGERAGVAGTEGAGMVAVGDLEGDGIADVVAADPRADRVLVLRGAGDGTFTLRDRYPVGDRPAAALIIDMNGDSRADIVTLNEGDETVSVILATATGYETAMSFEAAAEPIGFSRDGILAAADFDGSGSVDVAVPHASGVAILPGMGDGRLGPVQIAGRFGAPATSLVAGDFNEDGVSDLATTPYRTRHITVLLGRRGGPVEVGGSFFATNAPLGTKTADLNGDGHLDLVAVSHSSPDVAVLMGRGDGTFDWTRRFASFHTGSSVALADYDGDGDLDVVTSPAADIQMHDGSFVRCATPHDTSAHHSYRHCSLSTAAERQQTLKCET